MRKSLLLHGVSVAFCCCTLLQAQPRIPAAKANSAAAERARNLKTLIASNPAAARAQLSTAQRLDYTGPVDVSILHSFKERRSVRQYTFELNGETIQAYQPGSEGPAPTCGDTVRLKGLRLDDVAVVNAISIERHESNGRCTTTGEQKLLVIAADFPSAAVPQTAAQLGDTFFSTSAKSVATYINEVSGGKTSLTGEVVSVKLDRVYACEEFDLLRIAATRAAAQQRDLAQFPRVAIVAPAVPCWWTGKSTLGCRTLRAGSNNYEQSQLILWSSAREPLLPTAIHEFGHGLGLDHATTMRFAGSTLGADTRMAAFEEYGDFWNVMGESEFSGHFGAAHQTELGWMREGPDVATALSNGSFALSPIEAATSGQIRALKIKRKHNDEWLWLEYHQPLGRFAAELPADLRSSYQGVMVRAAYPGQSLKTALLDLTAPTLDEARLLTDPGFFTDVVLRPGEVWRDRHSDLTLRVTEVSATRAIVHVEYEPDCVTISPSGRIQLDPSGRATPLSVTAGPDCRWEATPSWSWIEAAPGGRQAGTGTVTLQSAANPTRMSRTGAVTIGRTTIPIVQAGTAATPVVDSASPAAGSLPIGDWFRTEVTVTDPNGGDDIAEVHIALTTDEVRLDGCYVRLDLVRGRIALRSVTGNEFPNQLQLSDRNYVLVNSRCAIGLVEIEDAMPSTKIVSMLVRLNAGPAFLSSMAIDRAGAQSSWTTTQRMASAGTSCAVLPLAFRLNLSPTDDFGWVRVFTYPTTCTWEASTSTPWIRLLTRSGADAETVDFMLDANTSIEPRTGEIMVGPHRLTVAQQGESLLLAPAEMAISSAAGRGEVRAETTAERLEARSDVPWLRIRRVDGGVITFDFDANHGAALRRASISAGGRRALITQAAGVPNRPAILAGGVTNAASGVALTTSGAWLSIQGTDLAQTTRTWTDADFRDARLPTSLDGVSVRIGGKPALIYYISPTQINVIVPDGLPVGFANVDVTTRTAESVTPGARILILPASPGLFQLPAPHATFAAATHADGTLVAPENAFPGAVTRPAAPGDLISLYATGLGPTMPATDPGRLLTAPAPIARRLRVRIGNAEADVQYAGLISPGLYQVNITIPANARTADDIRLSVQDDDPDLLWLSKTGVKIALTQ